MPKPYAQRLRAARLRAGLSQNDLAAVTGIPQPNLSRYENGHTAPSPTTCDLLARALGDDALRPPPPHVSDDALDAQLRAVRERRRLREVG